MSQNIIIKSDEPAAIARGQAVVEARAPIEGEVKLLSVHAAAVVTPAEVFSGEARYVGKVVFDVMVARGGRVECESVVAEFTDKVTAPAITTGMAVTLAPELANVEAAVENGGIKAVAVVDVAARAAIAGEYACLSEPDEGIFAEKQTISYTTVCDEQTETVYITDSASAGRASAVLCADSRVVVTGAEAEPGMIKVSGAVYSVVYVNSADEPAFAVKLVTPFTKSVAVGCRAESGVAIADASVIESTPTLTEDGRVEVAVMLRLHVTALEQNTAGVVTDVFCADCQTETKAVEVHCSSARPSVTVLDNVDGQITLPAERPAADNVLFVCGAAVALSSVTSDDGKVVAEGLVSGDIVYYNAESNSVETAPFRLPFSLPLAVHAEGGEVSADAVVTDVAVRVRREAVFDIKAELAFTVRFSDRSAITALSGASRGAPIQRPAASVIVHIARPGETLWQAAKALCCSPESVEKNNDFRPPYSGGERLIAFCGKE